MSSRSGFVVVFFFFGLIFLILAGVFPLDAFKTLYDFDTFVIFAFKTNTFLTFLLWSGAGVSWEAILFLSWAALACLGVSWGRLGASWGRLGDVLGGRLRPPWVALRASWAALGRLGGVLGAFGGVLGCLGDGLGRKYAQCCAVICSCLE